MRTKTLPLPAAPRRFHSLRIQPLVLLHFRFSLVIPAAPQELLHSHPRALPPAAPRRFHSLRIQPLLHFRFSLLIPVAPREPLHPHPPALPPRLLPEPRPSLLRQSHLLRHRFPTAR